MTHYKVGVTELKAHLSLYLKRAQKGHTIIITLRGKPVAQLTPVQKDIVERAKENHEAAQKSGMEVFP